MFFPTVVSVLEYFYGSFDQSGEQIQRRDKDGKIAKLAKQSMASSDTAEETLEDLWNTFGCTFFKTLNPSKVDGLVRRYLAKEVTDDVGQNNELDVFLMENNFLLPSNKQEDLDFDERYKLKVKIACIEDQLGMLQDEERDAARKLQAATRKLKKHLVLGDQKASHLTAAKIKVTAAKEKADKVKHYQALLTSVQEKINDLQQKLTPLKSLVSIPLQFDEEGVSE